MLNLSEIKKLNIKKYRDVFKTVLVEGPRLIQELEKSVFTDCIIYCTEQYDNLQTRFEKNLLTTIQLNKISDMKSNQGIIATVPIENFNTIAKNENLIILDEIQDPGNLGTIIRSAAWFGNISIALTENSCDVFNPKVIRSSAGGIFHVNITQNFDLESNLSYINNFYALDMNGKDLRETKIRRPYTLLLGNEGNGLKNSIRENNEVSKIKISGMSSIESLNVGTTAAIAMFYMSNKGNQ